jgi:hypothetical protein
VQKVVDTILAQTKLPSAESQSTSGAAAAVTTAAKEDTHAATDASWRADASSKIILTGFKVCCSVFLF